MVYNLTKTGNATVRHIFIVSHRNALCGHIVLNPSDAISGSTLCAVDKRLRFVCSERGEAITTRRCCAVTRLGATCNSVKPEAVVLEITPAPRPEATVLEGPLMGTTCSGECSRNCIKGVMC